MEEMFFLSRPQILTDFKSELLAEQMTVLDAELFQKIEVHVQNFMFTHIVHFFIKDFG